MHLSNSYISLFLTFIFLLVLQTEGSSQSENINPYRVIIESIENLESAKDPKCHATAGRLEDFMFGTPLTDESREFRIDLQKKLIRQIWTKASELSGGEKINSNVINGISNELITFQIVDKEWYLKLSDSTSVKIEKRDYDHYSSIAYSLRALLSIQQEDLLGERKFLPLDAGAVERMKFVVDIITIGVLKVADYLAREADKYQIDIADLDRAWQMLSSVSLSEETIVPGTSSSDYRLTQAVINQKLASYEKYNNLSQKVFLRNIQVYFAQVPWPADSISSEEITLSFQKILIEFTSKLILDAHKLASVEEQALIRHEDVRISLQKLLPHAINEFEDVTFFNRLDPSERKRIEAYDLDAFRDSGVHWNYLEVAIRESIDNLYLEPNPFAMELLVEGIAQMGVLLWRMAGEEAKEGQAELLSIEHMDTAFAKIKKLSGANHAMPIDDMPSDVERSGKSLVSARDGDLFVDVTFQSGISFEHRTSDWLNRQIRSYIVEEEQTAKLAIPPAFGGGGVAAEDINDDGLADVLILGGYGIKIFKNNGDKTFSDITQSSGLVWNRIDGTKGEPRQPIIADFDNDGHQDIFISYVDDRHRIYRGQGDGTFTDYSDEAKLGGERLVGGPCTALDFDRDGLLDLYIGYFGNYLEGRLPTLKRHNDNGSPNKLYRNLGNFIFKDVTEDSGLDNTGWTQAVGHADINNDGWQDVIVGNDFGVNSYYINNKNGSFTDQSAQMGVDKPSYTMNIGFTDLNADDLPDFYISNIVVMEKDDKYTAPTANTTMHFNPDVLANMRVVEANDLFISQKESRSQSYSQSKSIGRGYSSTGWAWDADFFDYDNDGDDDLYCLNGMNQYSIYGTHNPYYKSPDGEALEATFAQSQSAKNVFFENNNGFLQNRSSGSGLDLDHTSRSAAYLDYDNDGDLDVIVNNYNGPAYFYENKSEEFGHNWIALDLKYQEGKSMISPVGTKVKVTTRDGIHVWRQVSSTTGYLSVHPGRIHAGLGSSKKCDIQIIWPDGHKSKHSIDKVNRIFTVTRTDKQIDIKKN